MIAGSLRKHEDSGSSWGRKALRYLVHNSTRDRKLQYKKEKGRNQGKHKCALQIKKKNQHNQNTKPKNTKAFPHRKFNKDWAELTGWVIGNLGWNLVPLRSRANTHQPGLSPSSPSRSDPQLSSQRFRHLNTIPNLVFNLMLPLGNWCLVFF